MLQQTYRLEYKKSVDKDLRKLAPNIRKQLISKILKLSAQPYPPGNTKLRGSTNLYRIRHISYRIIYRVDGEKLIILVVKVGHRKEVYRDL
ncbi:MAG: type II toxin-antitoxin system RelE/ParE family toxin [Candidatus Saccharimonadales bacterium]